MNVFDIARLAGVSRKTVQRALNGSPNVKPETKEKIRLIMEQHHYEPNASARKLSGKRTRTIGIFVIQDLTSYQLHTDDLYFGAVIGGIINQCTYHEYKTMITILDVSDPEPLMSMYKQKNIDAGVVVSWSNVQRIVERAVSAGFRIGVFDQNNVSAPPDSVPIPLLDNRAAAYGAGKYLLDLGHRDLGIITGGMQIACSGERLEGFLRAAEERGYPVPSSNIYFGDFTEKAGVAAIEQWVAKGRLPRAIFCSNDLMAYGALQALTLRGIRVPDDVSMIGFDDLLVSRYMHPPLTTMRVPRVEMAEALTARIIEMLEGEWTSRPVGETAFQAELVVRGSCAEAK